VRVVSGKQSLAIGGPQSRSALFEDEERFLSTPGIGLRSVGHLTRNLITTPTELYVTLIHVECHSSAGGTPACYFEGCGFKSYFEPRLL
jgi:hypothetical protein